MNEENLERIINDNCPICNTVRTFTYQRKSYDTRGNHIWDVYRCTDCNVSKSYNFKEDLYLFNNCYEGD